MHHRNQSKRPGMVRLALAGAGLVGKRHIQAMAQSLDVVLEAIVDPDTQTRLLAQDLDVPWFDSLHAMFAQADPDGVILATPTPLHVDNGLECVSVGCPILVEKPVATSVKDAQRLLRQARHANVAVLVGHHRRHNPVIRMAREIIDSGTLGQIRSVHANCWLFKPDAYFDEAPWRKVAGAGPIAVNLAHDVDLIRYLCGDVVRVQAEATPSLRGFDNEDVAAAVLRFGNGAVGTITVSDTIVAPWSWELTARENPAYPPTGESCYLIGGTHGSLSLPDLKLWRNSGDRSWWEPLSATSLPHDQADPLVNQVRHFAAVIAGAAEPLVSGKEGMESLRVLEAIQVSAATGNAVEL